MLFKRIADIRFFVSGNNREEDFEARVQQRGRRSAIAAVLLCVLAIAGLGVDYIFQPQRFPLKKIEIQGELHNTYTLQIQKILAENMPSNIFRINLAEAANVAESLPWIAQASVRRQWPDTLQVQVHEHVVEARWETGAWVERSGALIELPDYSNNELPLFVGAEQYIPEMLRSYRQWTPRLSQVDLKIRGVSKSARGDWKLEVSPAQSLAATLEDEVNSNTTIVLGYDNPEVSIERFVWLYREVFEPVVNSLVRVDLRYPNGIAVEWTDNAPKLPGSVKIKNS